MLDQVWPGLFFWYHLELFSSLAWLFSSLEMNFLNKTTDLVAFLRVTIFLSWFVANVLVYIVFMLFRDERRADDRFFGGYERVGKTVGSALLFFGNVGLYYCSEKSIACMLTFLFLALNCLCGLFCIQPYTDFGVSDFLLSASLNQALSLFGVHSYSSWLVFLACIVMAGLRYRLEPVQVPIPNLPSLSLEEIVIELVEQPNSITIPIPNLPSSSSLEEPLIPKVVQPQHESNRNLTLPVQLRTDLPTPDVLFQPKVGSVFPARRRRRSVKAMVLNRMVDDVRKAGQLNIYKY